MKRMGKIASYVLAMLLAFTSVTTVFAKTTDYEITDLSAGQETVRMYNGVNVSNVI